MRVVTRSVDRRGHESLLAVIHKSVAFCLHHPLARPTPASALRKWDVPHIDHMQVMDWWAG